MTTVRRFLIRAACLVVVIVDGLLATEPPSPWRGIDHQQGA